MLKRIDVTDLPDPLVAAIESLIRTYRERAATSETQSDETATRPVGWINPSWRVPASFFEPLPDDVLAAFEGDAMPAEPRP